jgi:hypothetical protein
MNANIQTAPSPGGEDTGEATPGTPMVQALGGNPKPLVPGQQEGQLGSPAQYAESAADASQTGPSVATTADQQDVTAAAPAAITLEASDDNNAKTSSLVSAVTDAVDSVTTPQARELLNDIAKDKTETYLKERIQESGVEGEIFVGAVEQQEDVIPKVSSFLGQAKNFVDLFTGNSSPDQSANTLFGGLRELGSLALKDTAAGTLFAGGSEGIWKAGNAALAHLDQAFSMFQEEGPYNAQQADQVTDFSDVAESAIFGICGYCEKLYKAQQIVTGEWNLLSTRFGWNVQ